VPSTHSMASIARVVIRVRISSKCRRSIRSRILGRIRGSIRNRICLNTVRMIWRISRMRMVRICIDRSVARICV